MLEDTLGKFNDLDVGVDFIKTLNLTEGDLMSPITENKVVEIIDFLNNHPDPKFVTGLTKYNRSQEMSNLDYLVGYVKLNTLRNGLLKQVSQVEKDIKFYEGIM